MEANPKQSKARELLWLAIAVMSMITGIHKTINVSFKESWYFFVFVIIALLMFFVWRNRRIGDR